MKIVYVTCPSEEAAEKIAREIVGAGLAACANLLPGIKSIYTWQGKIEESGECLMIIKTAAARLLDLEKKVLELHPYDTPEFVAIDASYVNQKYGSWIRESTLP